MAKYGRLGGGVYAGYGSEDGYEPVIVVGEDDWRKISLLAEVVGNGWSNQGGIKERMLSIISRVEGENNG